MDDGHAPASPQRVMIAHANPAVCETLTRAARELGYEVALLTDSAQELVDTARAQECELIMSGVALKDYEGVAALIEISHTRSVPAILVTPESSLAIVEKALQDHVMAYLVEPVKVDEIKPTVYLVLKRFEEFQALRQEVEDLKTALANRKLIERAKGVIMRRGDLNEDEAYRQLRRLATDNRIPLVAASEQVLLVDNSMNS